ncbi:hypothetical protein KP509_04G046800, partial [Ceratopteris richardii]
MPYIMGVHYIAHKQALATKDGFITHPHVYSFVKKIAIKVYSWLGKFSKRHDELWKIMSEYDMLDVKALQIHSVRWLSRGQVMERLVNMMPAILQQWEQSEKKWYKKALRCEPIPIDIKRKNAKELSDSEDDDDGIDLNALPCDNAKYNGSIDECISMAKVYVTNILDSLNKHFEDISVYNAFKVFSPSS